MPKMSGSANQRAKTRAAARVSTPANPRKSTRNGEVSRRTDELMDKFRAGGLLVEKKPKKKGEKRHKEINGLVKGLKDSVDDDVLKQFIDEHGPDIEDEDSEEGSRFDAVFETLNVATGNPQKEFRANELGVNTHRAMLAMVLSLIPVAEASARASRKESAFYALAALCNQARDLITDLRISGDGSEQADVLVNKILKPANLAVGRILLEKIGSLKNALASIVEDAKDRRAINRVIDEELMDLGRFISDNEQATAGKVTSYMLGDPSAFEVAIEPPRKKRNRSK